MSTNTKNTNYLAGMRCPSCKSKGDFTIGIEYPALVSDSGITKLTIFSEDMEDPEWDDHNFCICQTCGLGEKVADFREDTAPDTPSKVESKPVTPCIDPDPPSECPKCGADLVLADCYSGGLDFEGSWIYQEVTCPNDECGHRWNDIYRFTATMDCETGEVRDYRHPMYHAAPNLLEAYKALRRRLWIRRSDFSPADHDAMNSTRIIAWKAEGK